MNPMSPPAAPCSLCGRTSSTSVESAGRHYPCCEDCFVDLVFGRSSLPTRTRKPMSLKVRGGAVATITGTFQDLDTLRSFLEAAVEHGHGFQAPGVHIVMLDDKGRQLSPPMPTVATKE